MRIPRFTVRRLMIAVVLSAIPLALLRSDGAQLLGLLIVLGSMGCLAYARYTRGKRIRPGRWLIVRSVAEAVFIIGSCDGAFLLGFFGYIKFMSPRRTHWHPFRDDAFLFNCSVAGTILAVCLAVILRRTMSPDGASLKSSGLTTSDRT